MPDGGDGQPKRWAARLLHRRRTIVLLGILVALGLGASFSIESWLERRELVMTSPDTIPGKPALVRFAVSLGRPAYAKNCAGCHGADMEGNRAKGAPRLNDSIWLYDQGRVSDIERTIFYGIRSGYGRAHNVTDMPGLGVIKQLTAAEVHDVETYILSLSTAQNDRAAIERGAKLYQDKGNCYDCHGRDAEGNPDYGTPKLSDEEWLYGGDPQTVFTSIYDGRHGVCPAWVNKLSFPTIRALAVYIYEASHPPARPATAGATKSGNKDAS